DNNLFLPVYVLHGQAWEQPYTLVVVILFGRVAGDPDLDHQVAEVAGDAKELLRGREEERLGQVEREVEVPVDELVPLLPGQHMLHGLDRVALDLAESDQVHLLEEEDGVADADVAELSHDLRSEERRAGKG